MELNNIRVSSRSITVVEQINLNEDKYFNATFDYLFKTSAFN